MIKAISYVILCIWMFVLLSCSDDKTFHDLDEFEKFIRDDSPYLQTITRNGMKVSLKYMPTEAVMINAYRLYLEIQERLMKDSSLSKEQKVSKLNEAREELLKQKKAYDHTLYFHLTIGYEDGSKDLVYEKMRGGYGAYSQWLQKLLFSLQDYSYLQTPSIDEIPLDVYLMERTFGMRKGETFLLAFPAQFNGLNVLDPDNEWLKLQIKEFGLGTGTLTFTFKLPFKRVQFSIPLFHFPMNSGSHYVFKQ